MQYRAIPKTGDKLSILGFGCMRLPQKRGTPGNGAIDKARAERQLLQAMDQGVNYFDTAMPYHMGASEAFLGEVVARSGRREQLRLATKLSPWTVRQKADLDGILNAQLNRLRTERIDYYLLHSMQSGFWGKLLELDVLDFLDRAKRDGRIVNAGFSFHGDLATFKTIVDAYDWEFCQIQYNLLDTRHQAGTEGLKYAAERNLGVIIMEPLRGGYLSGRIPPQVAAVWQRAAQRRTPAQWALAWLWNHPEITVVLSGMNEEAHITENIQGAVQAGALAMPEPELALVTEVEQTYRRLMKAPCTGCGYCMPCPAGVNIPNCFEYYNALFMFDEKLMTRFKYLGHLYGAMGAPRAGASLCKACGQCESKCPQQLPIQNLLAEVAATFETRSQKGLAWFMRHFFNFQRMGSLLRARWGSSGLRT